MLVRHYIAQRLAAYYAQSAQSVVGSTAAPLPLASLWGQWHWMLLYQRLYRQTQGQWLTPVELFQPYYSQVVANYIAACCDQTAAGVSSTQSLEIVEFGGGRGTNALHVLDHLQRERPDVYERLDAYQLVDSSSSLHAYQRQVLQKTVHANKCRFVHQDLLHVAQQRQSPAANGDFPNRVVDWLPPSDRLTIVVALEVLDNLPHDKIRIRGSRGSKSGMLVEQAVIRTHAAGDHAADDCSVRRLEEVFVPLEDTLLRKVLHTNPLYREPSLTWVPTVLCGVLDRLRRARPNCHLLLADFDWLPLPNELNGATARHRSRPAYGEPLVTNMKDVDQACYLSATTLQGDDMLCDILFPTDFHKLAAFVEASWPHSPSPTVHKQAGFLQTYGPEQVAATQSWMTGFTPLLEDFRNCSVLTTLTKS
jgi:hypothetical protein